MGLRAKRDALVLKAVVGGLKALEPLLRPFDRYTHTKPRDLEFRAQGAFTGLCRVREYTADGHYVGRCDFGTKNGYCPRHGDVTLYLLHEQDALWPRDYELPKYDGQEWAEHLRGELHDRHTE